MLSHAQQILNVFREYQLSMRFYYQIISTKKTIFNFSFRLPIHLGDAQNFNIHMGGLFILHVFEPLSRLESALKVTYDT